MNREKVLLSWSSGKDSAWALQVLRERPDLEVAGLITTLNEEAARVAMHAVREELLDLQAAALRLPLLKVGLPYPCSNAAYEARMAQALHRAAQDGITALAFGDLFLEDVRRYREDQLSPLGLRALFPLWGLPTHMLAEAMIAAGLAAVLTCVDPRQLDPSFAGRRFDRRLLADLPDHVDPCGENGEFHTLVYDAPSFAQPLPISIGETITRDGFVFTDVIAGQKE